MRILCYLSHFRISPVDFFSAGWLSPSNYENNYSQGTGPPRLNDHPLPSERSSSYVFFQTNRNCIIEKRKPSSIPSRLFQECCGKGGNGCCLDNNSNIIGEKVDSVSSDRSKVGKFLQKLWCCVSGDCSRFGLHHSIEKHCNNFSDDKNSLQKCVGFWRKNDWFCLKEFLADTYQLFAP